MHWACAKITASSAIQDSSLLEILLDKVWTSVLGKIYKIIFCNISESSLAILLQIKLCKGISYAAIASHADNSGRRKLAAMIVDHEPRSSKQVRDASSSFDAFEYYNYIMWKILYLIWWDTCVTKNLRTKFLKLDSLANWFFHNFLDPLNSEITSYDI